MRVKAGIVTRRRHNKILKANKGYVGRAKRTFRVAHEAWMKAGQHAFVSRKLKKRDFRALWINRINAAVRAEGMTYSRFIEGLTKSEIVINRKMLSELAINEPATFKALVEKAKSAATAPARK